MRRRIWLAFAVALLVAASFAAAGATAKRARSSESRPKYITHGLDFLHARQVDNGGFSTAANTSWVVLGAVASGERMGASAWSRKGKNPFQYLQSVSHVSAATSYSVDNPPVYYARAIIAYVAVNQVARVYTAGTPSVNLLDKLYDYQDRVEDSDSKGAFSPDKTAYSYAAVTTTSWAILALHSLGLDGEDEYAWAAEWLVKQQKESGGFPSKPGASADVLSTALAVQALSVAPESAVDRAVLTEALAYMKTCQNQDRKKGAVGGFPVSGGGVTNAEATAAAMQAILACGQKPDGDAWKVGQKTPVTALLSLQKKSGAFRLTARSDVRPLQVTSWALIACRRQSFATYPADGIGEAEPSFRFRPNLRSISPKNGAKYTSTRSVLLRATYTDFSPKGTGINVDACRVYVDNDNRTRPAKIGKYRLSLQLKNVPNGPHTYRIKLVDEAGNEKAIERKFTVSVSAPTPAATSTYRPYTPAPIYPTTPSYTARPYTPHATPTPTSTPTHTYSAYPYYSQSPFASPFASPSTSSSAVTGSPLPSPSTSASPAGAGGSGDTGSAAGFVGGTLLAMLPIGAVISYLVLHRREEVLGGASQGAVLAGGGSAWERFKTTLAKSKDLTRPVSRD